MIKAKKFVWLRMISIIWTALVLAHSAQGQVLYLPPEEAAELTTRVTLEPDSTDKEPLRNRTPLILIHGWNSGSRNWGKFSKWWKTDNSPRNAQLRERFKLYRFSYNSLRSIADNGDVFAQLVEKTLGQQQKFVIIGHSMGGLVARSAIENFTRKTPNFAARLVRLITLSTPHHGSPQANTAWLQNFSLIDRTDIGPKILAEVILPLNTPGGDNLGWDNYDGAMPSCVWEGRACSSDFWKKAPPPADRFITTLNANLANHPQKAAILAKYKFYAGYLDNLQFVSPGMLEPLPDYNRAAATILAYYFHDELGQQLHNYEVNDGVVPIASSLLLNPQRIGIPGQVTISPVPPKPAKLDENGKAVVNLAVLNQLCPTRFELFRNLDHSNMAHDEAVFEQIAIDLSEKSALPETNELPVSSPILVIDRSGSIQDAPGVMGQIEREAGRVVKALQSKVNQAAVINFSGANNAKLDANFTSDPDVLLRAIQNPSVGNTGTAIYDAVKSAVDVATRQGENAMVILLTDGKNNQGRGLAEVIRYCKSPRRRPIPILIVGFSGTEGRNSADLRKLAESTGAFYMDAEGNDIERVLDRSASYSHAKKVAEPAGNPF